MRKYFSILLIVVACISLSLHAQTSPFVGEGILSDIQEQVSLTVSPTTPNPGEVVTFRVESFSTNLNKGTIAWFRNGVEVSKGIGRTTYSVVTPSVGEPLTVDIVIQTEEGNTIQKNYSITPASVTLVYEADSYTPPFYKGKALFPLQGGAKIIAIPNVVINGNPVSRDNLVYTWSVDGRVIQNASGYGMSTYYYQSDILSQNKFISVRVSAPGSNASTEGEIYISPFSPQILIYENNSAYGIIERNLANLTNILFGKEVRLTAYPLYMSVQRVNDSALTFNWTINGQPLLPELNNQPSVLFRNEENREGNARIAVTITEASHILQSLTNATQLLFKKDPENSEDFPF